MKIAFLNDTSAWYHWGCTGTSTAIKEAIGRRGHDVVSVPIDALHRCKGLPKTLADFDDPEFFKTFFKENIAVTKPILESDLVLINGEGSLHHLNPLPITLLYLAYAAKQFVKKPVQIVNHSCYPDGDRVDPKSQASIIYRGVYRVLDYIAIREHKSQEAMRSIGIEDTTLAFDSLPLYIRDHPLPRVERGSTIVLAGSVAWKAQGLAALADYIRAMAMEGFTIQLLTGAADFQAKDDVEFVVALKKQLKEGWSHVNATSMEEWLTTIASAALLLSGRFHYTIAACMLDTPSIVLGSNTPKNAALAEMAHLPPPQDYTAENLAALMLKRTGEALGKPPISDNIKQLWQERAEKNFAGLPY